MLMVELLHVLKIVTTVICDFAFWKSQFLVMLLLFLRCGPHKQVLSKSLTELQRLGAKKKYDSKFQMHQLSFYIQI